jgi:hypothetical protein
MAVLCLLALLLTISSCKRGSSQRERTVGPDPRSAEFLDAIRAPLRPVACAGGSELRLWGHMQFAESPDWDATLELSKIGTHWKQVSGPGAEVKDPQGTNTTVRLPEVSSPVRLEFELTMTNASGVASRRLLVDLHPH